MTHRTERGHLRSLINVVSWAIVALDEEMKLPPSRDRGARIAKICNELELEKDIAQRFAFTKPKKRTP